MLHLQKLRGFHHLRAFAFGSRIFMLKTIACIEKHLFKGKGLLHLCLIKTKPNDQSYGIVTKIDFPCISEHMKSHQAGGRYAIEATKRERESGWRPQETIGTGLRRTIDWYLKNGDWIRSVPDDGYKEWMRANHQARSEKTGV